MVLHRVTGMEEATMSEEPQVEGLTYEAPRALRVGDVRGGAGQCEAPGSGEAGPCVRPGNDAAEACGASGAGAAGCKEPGSGAANCCTGDSADVTCAE